MRGVRVAFAMAALVAACSTGKAAELAKAPVLLQAVPEHIAFPHIKGNDTGGIMSWSPDGELVARAAADAWCRRWDKYARMTSVQRVYGGMIGFNCVWSPTVGPYILPDIRLAGEPRRHRRPPREAAIGVQ